jgi:hypothetical protein
MRALSASEILASASHANRLLARYPFRWLAVTLLFLASVESVMLIPYVGFVLKAAVSGIVLAQVLVLYAAADAGRPPRVLDFWRGFQLPLASQLVLALTAMLPLAAGILFLVLVGEWHAARAVFFGHVLSAPQLDPDLFLAFKGVMYVTGIPLTFVSAAVAIAHLAGARAAAAGFSAARKNVRVLGVMLALSLAFELAIKALATPGSPAGAIVFLLMLIAFLTWNFAFEFAVATRVFKVQA